jgi:hypothetical protein
MAEILKNDLVIELLTKDGTNDSTVSAPFLRAGEITFTGDVNLAIRIADCFKLEENFVVTEGENEEPILERRGSTLVEHGTSFLTLHIDKDGNLLTYYLGRGSLDVHYLENRGAETLLELIKLYFSIPVRDSEVTDLRKVLVVEGYRNFAPKGSEVESQLEGYLKEHGIYALV